MQERMLPLLRCPVSRSALRLHAISHTIKSFDTGDENVVNDGILFAAADWFYPIIRGIPRLSVEAFIDYEDFLKRHLPDYDQQRQYLENKYPGLIRYVLKKNKRTKKAFSMEWGLFDYEKDRTWEADMDGLVQRFLEETDESRESIKGKLIFDAGCGNGKLDQFISQAGATVIGMDFSSSIERAYLQNTHPDAIFIQGDVQFPPMDHSRFDIVHSSGVLNHTNNPELSLSCIELCVRPGGKLSIWLYHPRKDRIHNLFNRIRRFTSKMPLKLQYYFLLCTLLPVSYIVKRLKGNPQNRSEMMIALMDWFTPEFRWEHRHDEVAGWFSKRGYRSIKVTTDGLFGFNTIGIKPAGQEQNLFQGPDDRSEISRHQGGAAHQPAVHIRTTE